MAAANKLTFRNAVIGIISILLIVYIIYQAYMIIYDPVGTETAYEYTYTDTIDTEVFVARSESYVVNRQKGTIVSAVEKGSRVSKGEEVAHIFAETEADDTYLKLREVDEQIERYSRLAAQSDNYVFNV